MITSLQLLQVLILVTSQSEGELFEESLSRVKRCVRGGASQGNSDDSDSDLKVVEEFVSMNLRFPVSKMISMLSIRLIWSFQCEHIEIVTLILLIFIYEDPFLQFLYPMLCFIMCLVVVGCDLVIAPYIIKSCIRSYTHQMFEL